MRADGKREPKDRKAAGALTMRADNGYCQKSGRSKRSHVWRPMWAAAFELRGELVGAPVKALGAHCATNVRLVIGMSK